MTLVHDPCKWPLHVIPALSCCPRPLHNQFNSQSWVDWASLYAFTESITFLKRWRFVVSARNVSCNFFYLCWASPFGHLVVLVLLLSWPFYNSQSFQSNESASPFERTREKLLVRLLVTLSKLFTLPLH